MVSNYYMNSVKPANNSTSGHPPLKEKQWIRKVREESDRASFKKIFSTYYKRLHGFARNYVQNRQEAEDIVQNVFLRIWAQRETWDPPGTLKSYLFSAVRNESLNVIRHKQVVYDAEEEVTRLFRELKKQNFAEKDSPEVEELRKNIQCGIDKLPARCREIFVLNRRSGLTYSEIAGILDISVNTVGTQMGRALKYLRAHLSDYLSLYAGIDLCLRLFQHFTTYNI